ncbi:hypothetical protein [Candidatus Accumulibacter contiguus]|jgi:hypothetical protein|uniref:hypothetical protein n=1 Tax=Candidatus Accumulibacter contiguus TaxID=2954381 RepID=UPI002FC324E0
MLVVNQRQGTRETDPQPAVGRNRRTYPVPDANQRRGRRIQPPALRARQTFERLVEFPRQRAAHERRRRLPVGSQQPGLGGLAVQGRKACRCTRPQFAQTPRTARWHDHEAARQAVIERHHQRKAGRIGDRLRRRQRRQCAAQRCQRCRLRRVEIERRQRLDCRLRHRRQRQQHRTIGSAAEQQSLNPKA